MKVKVIVVNGTNPNAEDIIAQVKKTGCKNLFFTGIGLTKARKLVYSLPPMSLKFATFRKLSNANEEFLNGYDVVSTIGDFVKGKGKKAVEKKAVEMNPEESLEESKNRAERFCSSLKNVGSDIGIYGYSLFKDIAKECGATKTLRRGIHYYAYFGKLYVRYR